MFELTDQAFARLQPLLVRRNLADGELAYYICYGPAETSLAELVRVAGVGWTVVRLPAGQGRDRAGPLHSAPLRRLVPACHLVDAGPGFLALQRARAAVGTGAAERAELAEPLVALNVPEIRRLLCLMVWPSPAEPAVAISLF